MLESLDVLRIKPLEERGAETLFVFPLLLLVRRVWQGLPDILNAVVSCITNARSEAMNARIQATKRTACGFRNPERFRAAILFHLGEFDLYPIAVIRRFRTIGRSAISYAEAAKDMEVIEPL